MPNELAPASLVEVLGLAEGYFLIGLIVWAMLVGGAITLIVGEDYPDWLFYSIFFGGPALFLMWWLRR